MESNIRWFVNLRSWILIGMSLLNWVLIRWMIWISFYWDPMRMYHCTTPRWTVTMKISNMEINIDTWGLLFNSRLWLFLGKLNSMWIGPFKVTQVFSSRAIELEVEEGRRFKVIVQRDKQYFETSEEQKRMKIILLDKVWVIKVITSCHVVNQVLLRRKFNILLE